VAARYSRVDPEAALELADRWITEESTNLDNLHQFHRVLLAGGRIEQAAALAEQYEARSTEPGSNALVRIRQLCAEGRTAEAEAYAASLDFDAFGSEGDAVAFRWHVSTSLGRPDEAADHLRGFDERGELFALMTFIQYTFFDPAVFPNLSARLRRNAALREQTLPLPYQCPASAP
jgi:hypothetical protein